MTALYYATAYMVWRLVAPQEQVHFIFHTREDLGPSVVMVKEKNMLPHDVGQYNCEKKSYSYMKDHWVHFSFEPARW